MITVKTNDSRIPVPPPPHPEASAAREPLSAAVARRMEQPTKLDKAKADPDFEDGIPAGLKRSAEERREAWKKAPPAETAPKTADAGSAKVQEEAAERKKAKAAARIAKLKATQAGDTAKMPLTGKAAAAALKPPTKKATTPAAASGKAKGAKKPVKATKAAPKAKKRTSEPRKAGTKLAIVADMIRRKDGCTTAEVLNATGWTKVGMPGIAARVGIKLITEKDGSVLRYRAG